MISAGQLRNRVDIQQRTSTQDELGQPVETWTLVAATWGDVRNISGLETIKADAVTSQVKASIRIRYRSNVTSGMRCFANGEYYNILAVISDRANDYCDLACEVIR
jgi:SPP1 family predicted phage head-tail adaptor